MFTGTYCHQNSEESSEFDFKMEDSDGGTFDVQVRMQSVINEKQIYRLYVLSDAPIQKVIDDQEDDLYRELHRVSNL